MAYIKLQILPMAINFGIKLLAAAAIFIIGRFIAAFIKKIIDKALVRAKVEQTLISFITNMIYFTLLAFVIIAALGKLGIQTTSFIAILGAAGLAIGLALQGSLSNFAAGVLLIIFRPFKLGDYIEGAGVAGTVKEIQIFTTILTSPDNKTIIVPNSKMMGDNIINYATQGTRRVDFVFSIGYEDDIDKAKKILAELVENDARFLKNPLPKIAVSEHADSSVNLICRPWVKADDYWNAYFDMMEIVKKKFDEEKISIPFPQRDVHVIENKG
ncbi:MAG: mechanosensitive ion channel protein [Deltaproteobacteria bacterium]|nr:MAG: mechanosensitive ion channel protein [Deltaproteobacteria bacterium]